MQNFPCCKCLTMAVLRCPAKVHKDGGQAHFWLCPDCGTKFTTRQYLLADSIVVGEDYKPGVVEASALMEDSMSDIMKSRQPKG